MNSSNQADFICIGPRDTARLRLFCFPFAGAGVHVFRPLAQQITPNIEVFALSLPGRDRRIREPAFSSWPTLIDATYNALLPYLDGVPFVFFGHSFGGRIAFEIILRLLEEKKQLPDWHLVSGCRSPNWPNRRPFLHRLTHQDFVASLRRMNGTPTEVLEQPKLMEMVEPTLRADMRLAELWLHEVQTIPVSIGVFAAAKDEIDPLERMQDWKLYTSSHFVCHQFEGGHFYLLNQTGELCKKIESTLKLSPHLATHDSLQPVQRDQPVIGPKDGKFLESSKQSNNPIRPSRSEQGEPSITQLRSQNSEGWRTLNRLNRSVFSEDVTIKTLFEQQVERFPNKVAIISENRHLTYKQLNSRANQLARHLISRGTVQGDVVGINIERSIEQMIALVAIIKAGAAYLPFDATLPSTRVEQMLSHAQVSIVISSRSDWKVPGLPDLHVVVPKHDEEQLSSLPAENLAYSGNENDLAYVNFTSGSIGTPKGVAIPHRGVKRLLFDTNYAHFTPSNVFLHLAPLSFDAATFEIWGALLHGGQCVLFEGTFPSISRLKRSLRDHSVNILFLTTALFNTIVDIDCSILQGVRQLFSGGEAHSVEHMRRALEVLKNTKICSVYGPTEATTFSSFFPVTEIPINAKSIPIGRALCRTQLFVLDENQMPVSPGTPGELYIGGPGLALGYLASPQQTAECFVRGFDFLEEERLLYKTGDWVRQLPDGNLDFLGRIDRQVKLHGYRIELTEIERILTSHDSVLRTAVIVQLDSKNEKCLTAFIVRSNLEVSQDKLGSELKTYLHCQLPPYMIPSRFCLVDELPLNRNGKIDRKQLESISLGETNYGTGTRVDSSITDPTISNPSKPSQESPLHLA